jgi:hypothetical protein
MLFRLSSPPSFPIRLACAALLTGLAGCETHHGDELSRAVDQGEHLAMEGRATFFDGQVAAVVTIGRGIGRGMGGRGGGSNADGSFSRRSDDDIKDMDAEQTDAYLRSKGALGSPMPPVTLHLRLTNQTKSTVSVEIDDFESDLGNFAVHPEVLALAPDQAAEPDAMISQMGVTSAKLPVKVTLKLGSKTETQTVLVANVAPPDAPATGGK